MTDKIVSIAHRYGGDDKIMSDDTAAFIRKVLEMAEKGDLVSIAIAGEHRNGDAVTGHTVGARRYQVLGALAQVTADLAQINREDAT